MHFGSVYFDSGGWIWDGFKWLQSQSHCSTVGISPCVNATFVWQDAEGRDLLGYPGGLSTSREKFQPQGCFWSLSMALCPRPSTQCSCLSPCESQTLKCLFSCVMKAHFYLQQRIMSIMRMMKTFSPSKAQWNLAFSQLSGCGGFE